MGKPFVQLLVDDTDSHAMMNSLLRAANGNSIDPFDTVLLHRNGKEVNVSVSLSPIITDNRYVIGVAAIIRDITEQKIIEEQISQLNIHLENEVKSRTRELEAAKDEAIKESNLKSDFIANVSHEIRPPLTA